MGKSTNTSVIQGILEGLDTGLAVIDAERRVVHTNPRFGHDLALPEHLLQPGQNFAEIVGFCRERGDYGPAKETPETNEIVAELGARDGMEQRCLAVNGQHFECRCHHLEDGSLMIAYRNVPTPRSNTGATQPEEPTKSEAERIASAMIGLRQTMALFDAQDRLIFCNDAFRETNHRIAEIVAPGITFEEILRQNIERGAFPNIDGDIEAFVNQRLQ